MVATTEEMLTIRPPSPVIIERTTYLVSVSGETTFSRVIRSIVVDRHVREDAAGAKAGVVDQAIERPELAAQHLHEAGESVDIGEVEGAEVQCAARLPRDLFPGCGKRVAFIPRDGDHRKPEDGQRLRDAKPETAAAARDEDVTH